MINYMYNLKTTSKFKTSFKKHKSNKSFKRDAFELVVLKLLNGEKLESNHKDHSLSGNINSFRECHISPDILLIYRIKENELTLLLINLGSHSALF